jgi:hypothetical protein
MSNRTCQAEGCPGEVKGHGWCSMHYQRWRRTGGTESIERPSVADRFWAKVDRGNAEGCWDWTGAFSSNGYGHYFVGREHGQSKSVRAHRFAYELSVGDIPEDLVIDHLCRNRGCVNPAHLEPVTTRENIVRGEGFAAEQARRTHCVRGGHPLSGPNLYVNPRGERECRTCRADSVVRRRARLAN